MDALPTGCLDQAVWADQWTTALDRLRTTARHHAAAQGLDVTIDLSVTAIPDVARWGAMLRLIALLLADAIDGSLRRQLIGRIGVTLHGAGTGLRLTVEDDGWAAAGGGTGRDGVAAGVVREMRGTLVRREEWAGNAVVVVVPG